MKRLTRWRGSAIALLNELCLTWPVLKAARATLRAAYTWYDENAPELGGVVARALKPSVKQALKGAYESSAAVDRVKGDIKERAQFYCQYCGIGEGRDATLDHYIPKEKFPEYAVYPDNLVPCCPICNQKRGDRWLEAGSGARRHVHLFFDKIPRRQLLRATIGVAKSKVTIRYQLSLGHSASKGFAALYQRHVSSLDLLERYEGAAAVQFQDWQATIKWNGHGKKVGRKHIKERFARDAKGLARTRGQNHWKTALLYAASQSDGLIQYLCS
jgi:hypothetical protein